MGVIINLFMMKLYTKSSSGPYLKEFKLKNNI